MTLLSIRSSMRLICSQAAVQVEPALHHLDPQMILFVDHQAELSRCGSMATRAGALALGVLAADELPLDEELAVDPFQLRRRRRRAARPATRRLERSRVAQDLLDLGAVLLGGRG